MTWRQTCRAAALLSLLWIAGFPVLGSRAAVAEETALENPVDGEKPLWNPFAADIADALRTRDPRVVILDGDFGAPLLMLHEAGAGPVRDMERDGMPLGTGHLWSDDLWTVSLAGLDGRPVMESPLGASSGILSLRTLQADTASTRLVTEWFKGSDESYLRRLAFRTPRAPWVLGFDFEERILHDYDSPDVDPDEFPVFPQPVDDTRSWPSEAGESKVRIARTSLVHQTEEGDRLEVVHTRARKHKQVLPSLDLDRQEYWIDRTSAQWRGAAGGGVLTIGAALNGTDMVLEPRGSDTRTIETVRQLGRARWASSDSTWSLALDVASMRFHDDAAGLDWAAEDSFARERSLQERSLELVQHRRIRGIPAEWSAALDHRLGLAAQPRLGVKLHDAGNRFCFELSRFSDAPGSEQLWTPWTTAAPGVTVRSMPNEDLEHEKVLRAAVSWSGAWAGLRYEATSSVRRTRDGIGWRLEDADPVYGTRGRWQNGLDIDGWTAGLRVEHVRSFAGRLRFEGRIDARGWSVGREDEDLYAFYLPPERSASVAAWWEHTSFSGDGIWELGWQTEYRGAMSDPWLPESFVQLPAATLHHATVMFRLVGTDLGVTLRNVTDSQVRLSSGAMSRGRDMRWRLQWTLWH